MMKPLRGEAANSPSPPSEGGDGRGEEARLWIAFGPLPTPSSRGEEDRACLKIVGETKLSPCAPCISICPNRRGPRRFCGARLCEPQHVESDRRAGFVKTLGGRQSSCGSQTSCVRHGAPR